MRFNRNLAIFVCLSLTAGFSRAGLHFGLGKAAAKKSADVIKEAVKKTAETPPPAGPALNPPAAPSALYALAVSSNLITLTWTDNSDNEDGFRLERKTDAGGTYAETATLSGDATSYADGGLSSSTWFYYRVRAYNGDGNSAYSNEASTVTPAPSDPFTEALNALQFAPLSVFPVDLDALFAPGSLAAAQEYIKLSIHKGGAVMSPFYTNFGTGHTEGTMKWYIGVGHAGGVMELRAPGRALLRLGNTIGDNYSNLSKSTVTVSGETCYADGDLYLNLDKDKTLNFDHVNPSYALVQSMVSAPNQFIEVQAGDHLGYATTWYGPMVDFVLWDSAVNNGLSSVPGAWGRAACLLTYFTSGLQTAIKNYYDTYIYAAMTAGGNWPQSAIDGVENPGDPPANKNIDGQVWGVWYNTSTVGGHGIAVFLSPARMNPETYFTKDPADPNTPNTKPSDADFAGLFSYAGHGTKGWNELLLKSGGNISGVFYLQVGSAFGGSYTGGDYLRFEVDVKNPSDKLDDELKLKAFTSLSGAQTDPMTAGFGLYTKDKADAQ